MYTGTYTNVSRHRERIPVPQLQQRTMGKLPFFATVFSCLLLLAACRNNPEPGKTAETPGLAATQPPAGAKGAPIPLADLDSMPTPDAMTRTLAALYDAGGDFRWPCPNIRLVEGQRSVAEYYSRSNTIVVEARGWEVCRSFGKDSLQVLGFLLGHELTHFYDKKSGQSAASTSFFAFGAASNTDRQAEMEADVRGLFLAQIAGFQRARTLLPTFIRRIYQSFELTDEALTNYPPQAVREQFSRVVQGRADTLFHLFQAASYFAAFGQYEGGVVCFQHLLRYYDGFEIYNNLGLAHTLAAMETGGKRADVFRYPLEFDLDTRLEKARATLTAEEKIRRAEQLNQAYNAFDAALKRRPDYKPALVNRLIVQLLQGQYAAVLAVLEHQPGMFTADTRDMLRALALAPSEPGKARELLTRLQTSSVAATAALARYNLAVLLNPDASPEVSSAGCPAIAQYPDAIGPQDLRRSAGLPLGARAQAFFYWNEMSNSTLFVLNDRGRITSFQLVTSPATALDHDLRAGRVFYPQKNRAFYGLPLAGGKGALWRATPCHLVVRTNGAKKIIEWAVAHP